MKKDIRPLLLLFFFISGACGLVYEVVWLRIMGLIFGNTTFATSTVLSGYMAGLGLGALYFGKVIDREAKALGRRNDPVRYYGWLEGGVGVYALLTPLIWKLIDIIHIWFYRAFDPSFIHFSLFRFVVSFTALLIPTFLMGGTLPVIAKYFVQQKEDTAKHVGLLYALNTLGAVIGVLFSSFISLYYFGAWQTVFLTAAFNFLIAYACIYKLNPSGGKREVTASADSTTASASRKPALSGNEKWIPRLLLVLFGFSGAVSMMYEIGWTRVLAIVLTSSVYAFSVMLATFLLGISLGSWFFSVYAKYRPVDLTAFFVLQAATAFTALLGLNRFESIPYYFVTIYRWSHGAVWAMEWAKFALSGLIMLPPTLCIGAMFSCFIHVYQRSDFFGREIGKAYFANTIGTILGSALTGFLIVPLIGVRHTLMLAAGINAAIGICVFLCDKKSLTTKRLVLGGGLALLVAGAGITVRPWNMTILSSDAAVKPMRALNMTRKEFYNALKSRQTLFYKEGLSATVIVNRVLDNISIAVNGKVDASTDDAFTQFLLGHLPLLIHPKAEKVLVIGLGSGSTVAAVAAHPVREIHCVELEEAVVEGARYFGKLNRYVLHDPRLKMFINDGRNFLLVRPDKYDVIISEPSNPWMAGVANLFAAEHYRTMLKRLNSGGVVCQWLHAYSMSPDDLRMIISTFSQAFNHVTLWVSYYPDLLLIGTEEPQTIDFNHIRESFNIPEVARDFYPHGIRSPEGFFSCFWLNDKALRRLSEGARINSDNHPYLEFSAPKNLYRDTLKMNFSYLNSFYEEQFPSVVNLDVPLERNAKIQREAVRGYAAKAMYAQAENALIKAHDIEPESADFYEVSGILKKKIGRLEEAALDFSKAIQLNPRSAESRFDLGAIYKENALIEPAILEMTQAVAISPDNSVYLRGLADALYESKQYMPALHFYDQLSSLKGGDFQALTRMMDIIFESAPLPQQIEIAKVVMNRYPEFSPAYGRLGQAYESNNRLQDALRTYQTWAKQSPDDSMCYLNMARVYDRLGQIPQSRRMLEKAVRLEPSLGKNPQIEKLLQQ